MLLLLFSSGAAAADTFVTLSDVTHLFRTPRRYKAKRVMFLEAKDPNETLDYEIDWEELLGTDSIDTSQWNVPTGITGVSASANSDSTTIWVSEGVAGTDYHIINRIATEDGRTFERTLIIPVRNL